MLELETDSQKQKPAAMLEAFSAEPSSKYFVVFQLVGRQELAPEL